MPINFKALSDNPTYNGTVTANGLIVNGSARIKGPGPWADITAFGAISDPNHIIDSTAAIQAAINSARRIYVPYGDFFCASGLVIPDGGYLFEGQNLQSNISFGPGIAGDGINAEFTSDKLGITFKNMRINGTGGTSPGVLVSFKRAFVVDMINCHLSDAAILVELFNCGHTHLVSNTFAFNQALTQRAIRFSNGGQGTVSANTFEGVAGSNITFLDFINAVTTGLAIIGNTFKEGHLRAFDISNPAGLTDAVIANNTQTSGTAGFLRAAGLTNFIDVVIANNTSTGPGGVVTGIDFSPGSITASGLEVVYNRMNGYNPQVDMTGVASGYLEEFGAGTPEAVVAAPVGSVYHRTDGGASTGLYVKESGGSTANGWVAK